MIKITFNLYILLFLVVSSVFSQEEKNERFTPDYTWKADMEHSSISFRTMHWGIVEIIGWFEEYDVSLKKENDDWTTSEIKIMIRPASVRLPNTKMAQNLQGSDFFSTEEYPQILFKSNKAEMKTDSLYIVSGDLTIKETTRTIDWEVRFNGDVLGTPGFTATGLFTLSEFQMNMNKNEDGSKFVDVGDTVWVRCNFRLYAQW